MALLPALNGNSNSHCELGPWLGGTCNSGTRVPQLAVNACYTQGLTADGCYGPKRSPRSRESRQPSRSVPTAAATRTRVRQWSGPCGRTAVDMAARPGTTSTTPDANPAHATSTGHPPGHGTRRGQCRDRARAAHLGSSRQSFMSATFYSGLVWCTECRRPDSCRHADSFEFATTGRSVAVNEFRHRPY